MLGIEIGFVGLVARIGWHPILPGGERMNHTCFKSRTSECPFGKQVIIPRPLNHDNGVQDVVLLLRLADHLHR
jgi:hypothetical protein